MNEEIILELVNTQIQFRFLHWQTKSFSRHGAYGRIYDSLDDLIDKFVEVCMGKHGRPEYFGGLTLEFEDLSEMSLQQFIDDTVNFLISFDQIFDEETDSDLLNVRDEMLQLINQGKYLFTLE